MLTLFRLTFTIIIFCFVFIGVACQQKNPPVATLPSPTPSPVALETPMVEPTLTSRGPDYSFLTLPVIDAFLSDESFSRQVQTQLSLPAEQLTKLRSRARQETAKLRETTDDAYTYSTAEAHEQAMHTLNELLGEAKAQEFAKFVVTSWGEDTEVASASPTPAPSGSPAVMKNGLPLAANAIPTDTRVVVNTPAFRMDVFQDGQLRKSYKIGIGYPEFPTPVALRKANTLIFNPTWTPPDEPWVEAPNSKVKVGQAVAAGSSLNPLGLIKIPIGAPSLIHGGKAPAKLGTFASHGCVGMTNGQVQEFAQLLAEMGGATLTPEQMAEYAQKRTETKNVKLAQAIPVELRYETIVVEDGKVHIYRDVYDRNTNSEEELKRVLATYDVQWEELSEKDRQRLQAALKAMSREVTSNPATPAASPASSPQPGAKEGKEPERRPLTRTIKGAKEMVVELAALEGKGYPPPVDLNTGTPTKPAKTAKKK
jgi:lipoprotein-anchoring transpeptidase ErfK/SrfK